MPAALFLVVMPLMPFHDDWSYVTAPNPCFTWSQLLPGDAFWRPMDVLWGAMLGHYPEAFPLANRVLIVFLHVLNMYIVVRILSRISKDRFAAVLGMLFFGLSSAVAATVVNTDTINQVGSFFFGATALLMALSDGRNCLLGRRVLVCLLLLTSILFKESGVSWLAVIPVVLLYRDGKWRRFLARCLFSGALLLIYFTIRFLLRGDVALGDGSYYSLGFDATKVIVNFAISIIMPVMSFDGLAFVFGRWSFVFLTLLASIVFWLVRLWESGTDFRQKIKPCSLALFVAGAMSAPHCFFKGHHPAEMHFYPVLFAPALLIAVLSKNSNRAFVKAISIMSMFVLFGAGWFDKLSKTYQHSVETQRLFYELKARNFDYNEPVYFVLHSESNAPSYSTFYQSAAHGLEYGLACRAFNEWMPIQAYLIKDEDSESRIPAGAQKAIIW